MARFIKTGQFTSYNDKVSGGFNLPVGSTAERTVSPRAGKIRFNTDSNALEYYDNTLSQWESLPKAGKVTITKDSFTGDGSTTVFNMSVTPSNEETIFVFVGNVYQNPGVAYTVIGSNITFSGAPPDTHTIVILHGFDNNQPD